MHILCVLSGKGGVGKSTVTTHIATALAQSGLRVGVLDVDLTGPSIPRLLGVSKSKVHQSSTGWVPVHVPVESSNEGNYLRVMSIGFLLNSPDTAVVWRGPKKDAMIKQFIQDVDWCSPELDILVVDTPPGTSDEHISVIQHLREKYMGSTAGANSLRAVMVTTPQAISLSDVSKEIDFCKTVGLPVLGLIENMSGFVCPNCSTCTHVFSVGGGEALAERYNVAFLGKVGIRLEISTPVALLNVSRGESGTEGVAGGFGAAGQDAFVDIIDKVRQALGLAPTSSA